MVVAGLIQGALLGLLPGHVLLRLLPEAKRRLHLAQSTVTGRVQRSSNQGVTASTERA